MSHRKQIQVASLVGAALLAGAVFVACGGGKDQVVFVDNGGAGGASGSAGALGGSAGSGTTNAGSAGESASKAGSSGQSGVAGAESGEAGQGGTDAAGSGGSSAGSGGASGSSGGGTAGALGSGGSGGSAAGSSGASGSGGSAGSPICNMVAQQGASVAPSAGTGTIPAATHGTIVAGTYTLTSDQYFGVALPQVTFEAETLVVTLVGSKATLQSVTDVQGTTGTSTITIDSSASPTDYEFTCINPPQPDVPLNVEVNGDYSATPTTLKISYANNGTGEVNTYVKK